MASALTYDEALAYLAQFINYEARPAVAYDADHFNVQSFEAFLQTLGAPHRAFPSVHIAGSKGKGSTAAFIASILTQAGLRTGLFTTPHLVTMRERTQIDRQLISPEAFAALVSELRDQVERSGRDQERRFRTFFELTTALSFLYFARSKVDSAVVEVGLGGRLDTTNVLLPQVAVLTPIGLEHTQILGDTLPAIAGEKAGIIKPRRDVVSAPQAAEVVDVFQRRCQEQEAPFFLAGRDFQWHIERHTCYGLRLHFEGFGQRLHDLEIPLLGRHQAANAAVALAVACRLRQQGWSLTEAHLRAGLAQVRWEGRLEVLSRAPWVLLDGAHTVESALCLRDALSELFPGRRLRFVLGMARDKRLEEIVATLAPVAHSVTATHFKSPRACDPQALAAAVRRHGLEVQIEPDPLVALSRTRLQAAPLDVICVTGSLILLGEIKTRLQGLPLEF
ncbi:MAG: folylpolyglutamate synthase/dihydrofolate synthase family protein [Candidatus Tectimicrobiota bacterium]